MNGSKDLDYTIIGWGLDERKYYGYDNSEDESAKDESAKPLQSPYSPLRIPYTYNSENTKSFNDEDMK